MSLLHLAIMVASLHGVLAVTGLLNAEVLAAQRGGRAQAGENGDGSFKGVSSLGCTELHFAAAAGDVARVRHVVAEGGDVNARTNAGRSALYYAITSNRPLDTSVALLDAGATPDAMAVREACSRKNIAVVELLVRSGGRPESGLTQALLTGQEELLALLLRHGANINALSDLNGTRTPLHATVVQGSKTGVIAALRLGANPNAVTSDTRETALFLASEPEIALLLVDAGADISALDKEAHTPVRRAAVERNLRVYDLLLKHNDGVEPQGTLSGKPSRYAKETTRSLLMHLGKAQGREASEMRRVLVSRGEAIVPIIIDSPVDGVFEEYCKLLMALGPHGEGARGYLVGALDNPSLRLQAAFTLTKMYARPGQQYNDATISHICRALFRSAVKTRAKIADNEAETFLICRACLQEFGDKGEWHLKRLYEGLD